MKTVDQLISDIIQREGGYINHPDDRGGPTNWGITQATLSRHRGHSVTADEVRALTQGEAATIYRALYYPAVEGLPEDLQAQAFDIHVNGGLQPILNRLTTYFGASPAEIVSFLGPKTTNIMLAASRIEYYRRIVRAKPAQKVFLAG